MTTFQLKLLAVGTMLIDHIGVFLYPQYLGLRVVGRIAFPIFAWLIANGARHTHNFDQYLARLLLFAVVSQFPFFFANTLIYPDFTYLNVFFTLFLGLFAIKVMRSAEYRTVSFVAVVSCMAVAQYLNTDYGALGVLSIVFFFLFSHDFPKMFFSQLLVFTASPITQHLRFLAGDVSYFSMYEYMSITALFSLIFINRYNGKQGPKWKYGFYSIYPVQYFLFFFLLSSPLSEHFTRSWPGADLVNQHVLREEEIWPFLQEIPDRTHHRLTHLRTGKIYTFEVVNTQESITLGLSGRSDIGSDGMLFVLPQRTTPSFWMKDMKMDLDIVWIRNGEIEKITRNIPKPNPGTQLRDLPKYSPNVAVEMVLEITAGSADQRGFKEGDVFEVSKSSEE